jgi:hypothetical protein
MAKVYQMGNQKPFFKGQTIKWPKYIKEVIRSRISKDIQYKDPLVSFAHFIVCPLNYGF